MARRAKFTRTFGLVVKERRLAAGLSQEALGDLAGIHRTHVSLIERAGRAPSVDVAFGLALALGVTLAELVRDAESRLR